MAMRMADRAPLDPGLKESILGDLRLANAFLNAGRADLGRQLLLIARARAVCAMRRVPKAVRDAAEDILKRHKVRVPVEELTDGDVLEYADLYGATRYARVMRIHPRARRIVIGPLKRGDFSRGWKYLASYQGGWRTTIMESQVKAIYRKAVVR